MLAEKKFTVLIANNSKRSNYFHFYNFEFGIFKNVQKAMIPKVNNY